MLILSALSPAYRKEDCELLQPCERLSSSRNTPDDTVMTSSDMKEDDPGLICDLHQPSERVSSLQSGYEANVDSLSSKSSLQTSSDRKED